MALLLCLFWGYGGPTNALSSTGLNGPPIDTLRSATHPDQNAWYAKSDASFNWGSIDIVDAGYFQQDGVEIDFVAVSGNRAYLAHKWGMIWALDISDPASPVKIGEYQGAFDILTISASGNYVYVGAVHALKVISFLDPASPFEVGSWPVLTIVTDIVIAGSYAYVAEGYTALTVIDISRPWSPVKVGSLDIDGDGWMYRVMSIAVSGNYAYIAYYNELKIVDISSPTNPILVGALPSNNHDFDVDVSGDRAYVADGGLKVVDVSDPSNPATLGRRDFVSPSFVSLVTVSGNYAYLHSGGTSDCVKVANISKPTDPAYVTSLCSGFYSEMENTGSALHLINLMAGSGDLLVMKALRQPVGYSLLLDQSPDTTPDTIAEWPILANYYGLADGTWYFHVRAKDVDGNWGPAAHYRIQIDTTGPGINSVNSATHPDDSVWYNNDSPAFSWTTTDPATAGYSYSLDKNPAGEPDTTSEGPGLTTVFKGIDSGSWYFHVRAQDPLGNWGPASHRRVRIDLSAPPQMVRIDSTTHPDENSWYANDDPALTWVSDPGASGYSYVLDQSPGTEPDMKSEGATAATFFKDVGEGVWYFHARAQDPWDSWGPPMHRRVQVDRTPPVTSDNAPADWQKDPFVVTFGCGDSGSGCMETRFRVDNSTFVAGGEVAINSEGDHVVEYYSLDNVGNTEGVKSVRAKLDRTAPTVSYGGPSGTIPGNGPTVTAAATDASPSSGLAASGATLTLNGSFYAACSVAAGGSVSCTTSGLAEGPYDAVVTVSDIAGNTGSASGTFAVNMNDAPVAVADSCTVDEGGTLSQAAPGVLGNDTDADGNALTAVKVSEPQHGTLTLNPNGSFSYAHDGSETTADSFSYRANDGQADSNAVTVSITVTAVSEAPTDITLSRTTVPENEPSGRVIEQFIAVDPEGGTHTFALVAGAGGEDNASFSVHALSGILMTNAVFDYETKSVYHILVRATDQGGLFFDKAFTITVSNVNEPPIARDDSAATTEDSGPISIPVLANDSDPEGQQLMIAWPPIFCVQVIGVDCPIDYTPPANFCGTDTFSYTVSDGPNQASATVTITVTCAPDDPTNVALSSASVAEGMAAGSVVGTLSTTDPDAGGTFTYTLVGGDMGAFSVVGSQLRTAAVFDYETKSSYALTVRSTDQTGRWVERAFAIAVTNVNEAPTSLALSATAIDENSPSGTVVGTVAVSDPDAETPVLSFAPGDGGADNAAFALAGTELRISVIADYESKPSHAVRLKATDAGGLSVERSFTITVNDVNEPPTALSLSGSTVAEGLPAGTVVGTLAATDPDTSESFSFDKASGAGDADNGAFEIVGAELRTASILDRAVKESLSLRLRVSDKGSLSFERQFTVTVAPNQAPTDIALSPAAVAENAVAGTAVGTLSATDPDGDAVAAFSLVDGTGGEDNAFFIVDGTTLRTTEPFDFEVKSAFAVRVRATDPGGKWVEGALTVAVMNSNDAPTIDPPADKVVAAGIPLVFTVPVSDQDGDSVFCAMTAAPPGALFDQNTCTFRWTPGMAQVGNWQADFLALDDGEPAGRAEASTAITVTPPLFFDDFLHGTTAGDPDWLERRGDWSVDDKKRFVSAATLRNLALTRPAVTGNFSTGRISVKVMLGQGANPNATIVFGYRKTGMTYSWRSVTVGKNRILVGDQSRTLSTRIASLAVNRRYAVTLDLRADGRVNVLINGVQRHTYKFSAPVIGRIGLAADTAQSSFDDVAVWSAPMLAP